MKESKKKVLRSVMNILMILILMILILVIGLTLTPILKVTNIVEMSWIVAFIPLMIFIAFQLIWLIDISVAGYMNQEQKIDNLNN